MAPSSLKKMSGIMGDREGNYASSNRKSSLDSLTNHALGLTLLPGSQIQRNDEIKKGKSTSESLKSLRGVNQQRRNRLRSAEPEKKCQTIAGRSVVEETSRRSNYPDIDNNFKSYTEAESCDNSAVNEVDEYILKKQGDHRSKPYGLSPSAYQICNNIRNGHHYGRKDTRKCTQPGNHCCSPKKRRKYAQNPSFHSSFQRNTESEMGIILSTRNCDPTYDIGDEFNDNSNNSGEAQRYPPTDKFCGSESTNFEKLLPASSGCDSSRLEITKCIVEENISEGYPLSRSKISAPMPHDSLCTLDIDDMTSLRLETNKCSNVASAILLSVELPHLGKASLRACKQSRDSPDLTPKLNSKPQSALLEGLADIPRVVLKPDEYVKRSWTRHFPARLKATVSKSRSSIHSSTSSATRSCSISSRQRPKPLKVCLACECCDAAAHLDSSISPTFLPTFVQVLARASCNQDNCRSQNITNTESIEIQIKTGLRRSKSLPDLRLLYQSSTMDSQYLQQQYRSPTSLTEPHATAHDTQPINPQIAHNPPLPFYDPGHVDTGNIHANANPSLGIAHNQHLLWYTQQTNQHALNPNPMMTTNYVGPYYGAAQTPSSQAFIGHHIPSNDGRASLSDQFDQQPHHSSYEYRTLFAKYRELQTECQAMSKALDRAHNSGAAMERKIKGLESIIKTQEHQLKLGKSTEANPPENEPKPRSPGPTSIVATLNWARQLHPVSEQEDTSVGDASSSKQTLIDLTGHVDARISDSTAATQPRNLCVQDQPSFSKSPLAYLPPAQAVHTTNARSEPGQLQAQLAESPFSTAPLYVGELSNPYFSNSYRPEVHFNNPLAPLQQEHVDPFDPWNQTSSNPLEPHSAYSSAQADESGQCLKRKRRSEPAALQIHGQDQGMLTNSTVSSKPATEDEKIQAKAYSSFRKKNLEWYKGVHPGRISSALGEPFGQPSATRAQTRPARTTAASPIPIDEIAPTPSKAPRKTKGTPKIPKEPLDEAGKIKRAEYLKERQKKYRKTHNEKKMRLKPFEQKAAPCESSLKISGPQVDLTEKILPGIEVDPSKADEEIDWDESNSDSTEKKVNEGIQRMDALLSVEDLSAEERDFAAQAEEMLMNDGPEETEVASDRESEWSEEE